MKSKIICSLIALVLLSSCIKDFYGHPNDKEGILSENNYVYVDDLKRVHLENIEGQINIEIKQLDTPNASEEDKNQIATLKKQLSEIENELNNIADFRESVFKRRPPSPPCPNPQNCMDWLRVQYLTQRPGLDKLQMIIYDTNQNVLAQTEGEIQQVTGMDEPLDYVVLLFKNTEYRGDIQIEVIETTGNDVVSIFINSKIE